MAKRKNTSLRKVAITRGFTKYAEGSVLIEVGNTKVVCTASVENNRVPPFLRGRGVGWITAEYGMLPRATHTRSQRDSTKGKPSGRGQEIQRFIGRCLRSVVDMEALGERTVWIDCDVIQADGGTRTASVTGSFLALCDALEFLRRTGDVEKNPVRDYLAAVSVGIYRGMPVLDLCYAEDSEASVDMNVVMTGSGGIVEIQGAAEKRPFSRAELDKMLALAEKGIQELIRLQEKVVGHSF